MEKQSLFAFAADEFDVAIFLKVVIRNRQDLDRFVVEQLAPVPGIARVHTSIALNEVKSTTVLPLGENSPPSPPARKSRRAGSQRPRSKKRR